MTYRVGYDKFPGGRAGVSVGCILYQPDTKKTYHVTELLDEYVLAEPGPGPLVGKSGNNTKTVAKKESAPPEGEAR